MLKRVLIFVLLACTLVYGVVHLFLLRFATGDVYPEYSSLRSDPFGIKALYDAASELPHLSVQRNYRPIVKWHSTEPTTLIYAGTPYVASWGEAELAAVEALMNTGSRVVISFLPESGTAPGSTPSKDAAKDGAKAGAKAGAKGKADATDADKDDPKDESAEPDKAMPANRSRKPKADSEQATATVSFTAVAKKWGFKFRSAPTGEEASKKAIRVGAEAGVEPEVTWHGGLTFELTDSAWKPLYTLKDKPVVVERPFGKGFLVLASDSYFLSNEAMRNERCPKLLAWVFGVSRILLFDEESHGIAEHPGIAALMIKYGLQGAVAVLVGMALLFIYKNAMPLVPAVDGEDAGAVVLVGKQASEGFVNLLRRSIAPGEVLAVCVAEWGKTFNHNGRHPKAAAIAQILAEEALKPARTRDPVKTYQIIAIQVVSRGDSGKT